MPAKASEQEKNNLELFLKVDGLDERTAKHTIANNNVTAVIHELLMDAVEALVAKKFPANALVHRPVLAHYIVSSKFQRKKSSNLLNEVFEENKSAILEQRYKTNAGDLFAHLRKRHPWADPEVPVEEILNPYAISPQPEENFKAMFIDFGLAKERGGGCYLRFDDTNHEAEKKEYIDHIQEIVNWMGWEPYKITYTSDYFQDLYELAVELIRRGHAYIDHQTGDEIKEYREKKMNSPWRDRPIK
ncbi:putative glutamine--tRNA ligase [Rosa chinensis]|uniref:Putative glutamine--tRNA ligase n=1 Tax=Rosa chinensis TaxID=74649 RepID=A0A2P6PPY3_ROSCH|nr:putative glutamine--tRNA ligase [Rosa chinensis]